MPSRVTLNGSSEIGRGDTCLRHEASPAARASLKCGLVPFLYKRRHRPFRPSDFPLHRKSPSAALRTGGGCATLSTSLSITSAHHHSPQTIARALLLCACPPRASTQPSAAVILAARLSTTPSPQPAPSCIHELASSSAPRYRRPRSPIELHGKSTCSPRADPRSVLPIETHFADHIGLFFQAPCHRAAAPTGFSDSRHEPGESRGLAPVAGPAGRRCFAK